MKILCVSDQIDPLVYSDSVKDRYADVDIILGAGDLPLDYLDFIVTNLNKPLLFIHGNHHVEAMQHSDIEAMQSDREYFSSTHLGSKVRREEGLIIAGLGGSMRYNRGLNQFTELQMYGEIARLIPVLLFNRLVYGRFLDILLTHAPPRGIHDKPDKCHRGFKAFVWFIKVFRPRYLVHGHIHLYDMADVRRTRYLDTDVINACGHYIIDTAEGMY
jgi:Icc-related predicted phosphoesterase